MQCPNCVNETQEPLSCSQCGSSYCDSCQPYWQAEREICSHCSERNTIEALKEVLWTGKLRRWFNKPIPVPVAPALRHPLPWMVNRLPSGGYNLLSCNKAVGWFRDKDCAEHACNAANAHHDLKTLAVLVYTRIRNGDPFWHGGKADCALWKRIKGLLK